MPHRVRRLFAQPERRILRTGASPHAAKMRRVGPGFLTTTLRYNGYAAAMTHVEHPKFEQPLYPRSEVVIWVRPDNGRHVDTDLWKEAHLLVTARLAEGEEILHVDRPGYNNTMPDPDVNGRAVDPVAEKVAICSCVFQIGLKQPGTLSQDHPLQEGRHPW